MKWRSSQTNCKQGNYHVGHWELRMCPGGVDYYTESFVNKKTLEGQPARQLPRI